MRCCVFVLLLLVASVAHVVRAQQPTAPPADASHPYTLRVFERLLQVPTLVLDPELHGVANLRPQQFSISLDAGPLFHPTHMRLQGDDPITLAVLFDTGSDAERALLRDAQETIAQLYPSLIASRDQVSIYAADCTLVRSLQQASVTQYLLRAAVGDALTFPALHGAGSSRCKQAPVLLDEITVILRALRDAPGRRIVLVVSSGDDRKAANAWPMVAHFAAVNGITILAIRAIPSAPPNISAATWGRTLPGNRTPEDTLALVCAQTGGVDLFSTHDSFSADLRRLLTLVRERYILEFPPPRNDAPGSHEITVTVAAKHAIARASGLSYAPHPSTLANDPNVVQGDTTGVPEFGTRHHLPNQ